MFKLIKAQKYLIYQLFFLVVLSVGPQPGGAVSARAAAGDYASKIESGLTSAVQSGQPVNIFVIFSQKPDLSPAVDLDFSARGNYVFTSLKSTAETSQPRALQVLKSWVGSYGSYKKFFIVNTIYVGGVVSTGLVEALAALPEVEEVVVARAGSLIEPVESRAASAADTGITWGVTDIAAPEVWSQGYQGQGIVVASLDSGARYTHEALIDHYRGNLGDGEFDHSYNWFDPVEGTRQPTDTNGHGTHTVGTMVGDDGAGHQIGVAPGAQWIACRAGGEQLLDPQMFLSCGEWFLAPTDINGLNPDPEKRPHIINNSWGYFAPTRIFVEMVENWRKAGIFPAFAAGNEGLKGCMTLRWPGAYDNSFTVGAYGQDREIADFSSRGPSPDNDQIKPDVAAPGVEVYSSSYDGDHEYTIKRGTSMACPHVAGLVALLWNARPELVRDIERTEWALRDTAWPVVDVSCDIQTADGLAGTPNFVWGYGRADAARTVSWMGADRLYLTPASQRRLAVSGEEVTYSFTLVNKSAADITVSLSLGDHLWTAVLSATEVTVPAGGEAGFQLDHIVPFMDKTEEDSLVITAASENGDLTARVSTKNMNPGQNHPGWEHHTLMGEDFENGFPPRGWSVENNGGSCGWQSGAVLGKDNQTGGQGDYATVDTDSCPPPFQTQLRTLAVDLSATPDSAELRLNFKANSFPNVQISTDGGATWDWLEVEPLNCNDSSCVSPYTLSGNLEAYRGKVVNLAFLEFQYSAVSKSVQIDDVSVFYMNPPASGASIGSIAALGCSGICTYEITLYNFVDQDIFDLKYSVEKGSITGPEQVGPVVRDGQATISVQVVAPEPESGSVSVFTIEALGRETGATAQGIITKTLGSGEWTVLSGMPFKSNFNPVFAHDDKLYVISDYEIGIYDSLEKTWTTGSIQPLPVIEEPGCGIIGRNGDGQDIITLFPNGSGTGLHVYNIETNTWSNQERPEGLPDIMGRAACLSDYDHNLGYISGGGMTFSSVKGEYKTFYRYHPDTNTVDVLPEMATGRALHAIWSMGDLICLAGGLNDSGNRLSSTQCYDLISGAWKNENQDLPALPASWSGMAFDTLYGVPFLVGGQTGSYAVASAIWFQEDQKAWQALPAEKLPRSPAFGATLGGKFHLVGGTDNVTSTMALPTDTHQVLTICNGRQYRVTFTASPGGTLTGPTEQTVAHGENSEQVMAQPAEGYAFKGWSGDVQGRENPLIIKNIMKDLKITANFSTKTEASGGCFLEIIK